MPNLWHIEGQALEAAFFHDTWGVAQALLKKYIICAAKRFSIIYHITVWGNWQIGVLLAEKVPCTEAVRSRKGRRSEGVLPGE